MRVLFIAVCLLIFGATASAEQTPAGYIVAISFAGDDLTAKTAIVREGKELPPKLMMPVYSGDVIFVRDPASRVTVEVGGGETVNVGGDLPRYNVSGEIPTGDDAWSLLAAIGSVLAGEEDTIPENMVSKGDGLQVPLAVRGSNFIVRAKRALWLPWQGGTGPFTVSMKSGDREISFAPTDAREIEIPIPAESQDRLAITIRDGGQQIATVRFRLRESIPAIPATLRKASPGPSALAQVEATWLASLEKGAWTVEAAQMLHTRKDKDQAAEALLARMAAGWRP